MSDQVKSADRAADRESPERAALRRRALIIFVQITLLVSFLSFWEYVSGQEGGPHTMIDQFYVSKPSLIWDALTKWASEGRLWMSIFITLRESLYGFLVGAALGLLFGFVLAINKFLADVIGPFINAIYSIPRLALVPLFMLWFGLGEATKVFLVASVVFFLVFYATFAGVRDVDPEIGDRLKLMRASPLTVHLKATLPSAMTFIISGLRVSGPYALVVAVTAEMLSSNRGLGYLLVQSSNQFYTQGVFAALFVMMIVGILLMAVISAVERRLLRWKPRRPDERP